MVHQNGDVVQVRSDSHKRMWAGKIGKIVHIEQRPYGLLVDVEFEGGEVRTFGGSQLTKREAS